MTRRRAAPARAGPGRVRAARTRAELRRIHALLNESMAEKLEQLKQWRARSRAGGGERRVKQQRASGKQTARERLEQLLDPGTYVEIGPVVQGLSDDREQPLGEGAVPGRGRVSGRPLIR